jgi:hypothetical protein
MITRCLKSLWHKNWDINYNTSISWMRANRTRIGESFVIPRQNLTRLHTCFTTHTGLPEMLTSIRLVKKFPVVYRTRRFIIMFTRARQPEPDESNRRLPTAFPKIHFNITILHMPRASKWSLPFRFTDKKFVCISRVSHARYLRRPCHPPWTDHSTRL